MFGPVNSVCRALNGLRAVLQKFCVTQQFSTCGYTAAPKLRAHVTEGIRSARAKFPGD